MRAAEVINGLVVNVIEVDCLDVLPNLVDATNGGNIGDTWTQDVFTGPAAALPTIAEYTAAIQSMLDAKAQERRYYGILSASTYATSTNPTFKAEALACLAWRDAVWAEAYQVLDQVQAGKLAQPSIKQLLAMLPELTWPA